MDSLPRPIPTAPARPDVARRLVAEVRQRLRVARPGTTWRVERVEVEAETADALGWLAAQRGRDAFYWHGRGSDASQALVGAADRIAGDVDDVFSTLRERLPHLPKRARYVGGLRFAPGAEASPEWSEFDRARFVLPRVEYAVRDGRAVLAANLVFPRDAGRSERVLAELDGLRWPDLPDTAPLPLPVSRADAPDREGWRAGIESALDAFAATDLEKVVLARRADYAFAEPLDPFALLGRLESATPSCFHFLVRPADGASFVGASPERLFRKEGQELRTEAVAGTRPRGASASRDAELRDELRFSEKDQREHGYVLAAIRDALEPLSDRLAADAETSDLRLARGRHLYAGVEATLKPGVHALDVLRALHPTPAVGGMPTLAAMERIEATEPFDRGWYAGPVGWIARDDAEFAVAIRSGLVRETDGGATLSLYSGAGIVRGSEPEAEWAEIEQKIGDFARVLDLDA
jgi:menaquinone-specific isochorismate synthase